MRTREAEHGVGAAVGDVAAHAKSIARLELRLAALELKEKVTALGVGVALLAGAGFFSLFATGFALATIVAALAIPLPTWLALLIVTLLCGAIVGGLAIIGLGALKRGAPPVPRQAIEDAKLTARAVTNGDRYAS
jgi:hypothetical protein